MTVAVKECSGVVFHEQNPQVLVKECSGVVFHEQNPQVLVKECSGVVFHEISYGTKVLELSSVAFHTPSSVYLRSVFSKRITPNLVVGYDSGFTDTRLSTDILLTDNFSTSAIFPIASTNFLLSQDSGSHLALQEVNLVEFLKSIDDVDFNSISSSLVISSLETHKTNSIDVGIIINVTTPTFSFSKQELGSVLAVKNPAFLNIATTVSFLLEHPVDVQVAKISTQLLFSESVSPFKDASTDVNLLLGEVTDDFRNYLTDYGILYRETVASFKDNSLKTCLLLADIRQDPAYTVTIFANYQISTNLLLATSVDATGSEFSVRSKHFDMIIQDKNSLFFTLPSYGVSKTDLNLVAYNQGPVELSRVVVDYVTRSVDISGLTDNEINNSVETAYCDYRGLVPTPREHGLPLPDPNYILTTDLTKLPNPLVHPTNKYPPIYPSKVGVTPVRGVSELSMSIRRDTRTGRDWVLKFFMSQEGFSATEGDVLTIYDDSNRPLLKLSNTPSLKLSLSYHIGGNWILVGTSQFPFYVQNQKGFVTIVLKANSTILLLKDEYTISVQGVCPIDASLPKKIVFHGLSQGDPSLVLSNFMTGSSNGKNLTTFFLIDTSSTFKQGVQHGFSEPLIDVMNNTTHLTSSSHAGRNLVKSDKGISPESWLFSHHTPKIWSQFGFSMGVAGDIKGIPEDYFTLTFNSDRRKDLKDGEAYFSERGGYINNVGIKL